MSQTVQIGHPTEPPKPPRSDGWDTSSRAEFHSYYAGLHAEETTVQRFRSLRDAILAVRGPDAGALRVLDIGCGPGALCSVWAESGHRITGIDIAEPFIETARERAREGGLAIAYRVGSATELPFDDEAFDICCMPELLEHIVDWQRCLDEAIRVLRPGGLLYLATTNALCPVQQEFNLPLYSWYPGFLKRRFERLAMTTRPELTNYATYPAVHWFSAYGLARFFRRRGLRPLDRFDIAAARPRGALAGTILWLIRHVPGLRLMGHLFSRSCQIVARKP